MDEQGAHQARSWWRRTARPEFKLTLADPYRSPDNMAAKVRIAQAAVKLIQDEENVIIDSGSTTFQMSSFFERRRVTVLTNSFPIAEHYIIIVTTRLF